MDNLYFLHYDDLFTKFGKRNERYDYYIFSKDEQTLNNYCNNIDNDEYPFVYLAQFSKDLNLISINDNSVKELFDKTGESSYNDSFSEFLEDIDWNWCDTPVVDLFYDIMDKLEVDGLTDCPMWDYETGTFKPNGIVVFYPKNVVKYVNNVSTDELDEFYNHVTECLENTDDVTLEIQDTDDYLDSEGNWEDTVSIPRGVYLLCDYLTNYDTDDGFFGFLINEDEDDLYNKIISTDIYDSEKDIYTAIKRYDLNDLHYSFDRGLYDTLERNWNLNTIVDYYM